MVQTSAFGKIVVVGADIWSSLCWVGVLFLGFCCPLSFLGECGGYVLHGREFFWDPNRCDYLDFQENVFLGIGN